MLLMSHEGSRLGEDHHAVLLPDAAVPPDNVSDILKPDAILKHDALELQP
jgi:hypothetical protein